MTDATITLATNSTLKTISKISNHFIISTFKIFSNHAATDTANKTVIEVDVSCGKHSIPLPAKHVASRVDLHFLRIRMFKFATQLIFLF